MKTLKLEAVVRDGELPPDGMMGQMDYLDLRRERIPFYNPDVEPRTHGHAPDAIAEIGRAHV